MATIMYTNWLTRNRNLSVVLTSFRNLSTRQLVNYSDRFSKALASSEKVRSEEPDVFVHPAIGRTEKYRVSKVPGRILSFGSISDKLIANCGAEENITKELTNDVA